MAEILDPIPPYSVAVELNNTIINKAVITAADTYKLLETTYSEVKELSVELRFIDKTSESISEPIMNITTTKIHITSLDTSEVDHNTYPLIYSDIHSETYFAITLSSYSATHPPFAVPEWTNYDATAPTYGNNMSYNIGEVVPYTPPAGNYYDLDQLNVIQDFSYGEDFWIQIEVNLYLNDSTGVELMAYWQFADGDPNEWNLVEPFDIQGGMVEDSNEWGGIGGTPVAVVDDYYYWVVNIHQCGNINVRVDSTDMVAENLAEDIVLEETNSTVWGCA